MLRTSQWFFSAIFQPDERATNSGAAPFLLQLNFTNQLADVNCLGKELKRWLERAAVVCRNSASARQRDGFLTS
jgi:hypothetical protein